MRVTDADGVYICEVPSLTDALIVGARWHVFRSDAAMDTLLYVRDERGRVRWCERVGSIICPSWRYHDEDFDYARH